MIYYHGTTKEKKGQIIKNGFVLSYGRFGIGAYFSSNLEESKNFGPEILKIEVSSNKVKEIYYPDLIKIYPDLSIDEEEGISELKEYVISQGYLAASIKYVSNDVELCIYDTDIINKMQ
jgi:hypothetical protein